jgi:hypothetical protein
VVAYVLPSFVTTVVIVAVTLVVTVFVVDAESVVELLILRARTPPMTPPGGEVDTVAFLARALNAARVLPVLGALIEATIPDWQWSLTVWPQYSQIGFTSLTRIVKVIFEVVVVGMKVEKKPPLRGWQGSLKEDWVTEWFWENS